MYENIGYQNYFQAPILNSALSELFNDVSLDVTVLFYLQPKILQRSRKKLPLHLKVTLYIDTAVQYYIILAFTLS